VLHKYTTNRSNDTDVKQPSFNLICTTYMTDPKRAKVVDSWNDMQR